MKNSEKKQHWEHVFATKQENEVSWFQPNPETSLHFFEKYSIPKSAAILEIGGGDSYLIDKLLEKGYTDVALLDISENAVLRIKKRLVHAEGKVKYIVSDILDFKSDKKFDVIHDRASFHFLTEKEDIQKYVDLVSGILNQGGFFFLGTFSEDGPKKCSGLEITQYSEEKIKKLFSENFEILNTFWVDHQTPFDTVQNFIFCELRKK